MVGVKRRRSRKRHDLCVWMNGCLVGTWTVREHGVQKFQYVDDWIKSEAGRALSLSLPFQAGSVPHEGAVVENFFENLLPENREIRERLQHKFGAGSARAFDLLAEIGRDCAGAVQLLPEGSEPEGWDQLQSEVMSDEQVEKALKNMLSIRLPGQVDDDFRISIAGAQEKTALLRRDGGWHKPLGATPTTHIFKLPLGRVGNMRADLSTSVENEWLCSKIMAAYGVEVAHCDYKVFGDTKALIVERFDRKKSGQGEYFLRLPQEDMCQAMGVSPATKYEADGGPGIQQIMELLRGSSRHEDDRRDFFKAQILFWILAATDGHAKNFSIFHERKGLYRMTPLYDVLSAWPIIGKGANHLQWQDAKLAMAFRTKNAHYGLSYIQRRHFNGVAAKLGLGESAEDIIEEILSATPGVIETVREMLPDGFPVQVVDSILQGVGQSAERLKKMPVA